MRVSKPVLALLVLAVVASAGAYAYNTAKPRVHPIKLADAEKHGDAALNAHGPPSGDPDNFDVRKPLFGPARAVDGDTILVQGHEADLWTIVAPDLAQTCGAAGGQATPCGEDARRHLDTLIGGRSVACRPEGPPTPDGRWLGLCFVAEAACDDPSAPCESDLNSLNLAMVRQGWALDFEGQYSDPEDDARDQKLGLWADGVEPPPAWRQRAAQAAAD